MQAPSRRRRAERQRERDQPDLDDRPARAAWREHCWRESVTGVLSPSGVKCIDANGAASFRGGARPGALRAAGLGVDDQLGDALDSLAQLVRRARRPAVRVGQGRRRVDAERQEQHLAGVCRDQPQPLGIAARSLSLHELRDRLRGALPAAVVLRAGEVVAERLEVSLYVADPRASADRTLDPLGDLVRRSARSNIGGELQVQRPRSPNRPVRRS